MRRLTRAIRRRRAFWKRPDSFWKGNCATTWSKTGKFSIRSSTRRRCSLALMHYMVIERFKDATAIYQRLADKGRMMPEGLNYVSSWIDHNLKTCWQIMETEDFVLLERWIDNWKDLMEFEIIPVRASAKIVELMKR